MQDPQTMFGQRWVFRAYLCRWHLGASNKWAARMGPHFRQLKPIEFKPDSDLLPNIGYEPRDCGEKRKP
jgi:hypothetical protein